MKLAFELQFLQANSTLVGVKYRVNWLLNNGFNRTKIKTRIQGEGEKNSPTLIIKSPKLNTIF